VFLASGLKGVLVPSASELKEKITLFRKFLVYDEALRARHPEVNSPLVQEYLPAAETGVFSVSGFRSQEGEIAVRAAMKVLQRPRKLGIGLCFEGQPVEQELVDKLSALCARVGYYGTFEAEFIVVGSRRYLIDFNPRFYSQMGFDHARGLNHAMLAYFGALGEKREVSRLLGEARTWRPQGEEAYCHRGMLEVVLGVQRVSGRMTAEQVAHWRNWLVGRRGRLIDATWSSEDPLPAMFDSARWAGHFFRHPRSLLRHYVLNQ
jgi:D-aspartate ligase